MKVLTVAVLMATLAVAQKQIPSQTAAPGSTQDFSQAGVTKPIKVGTTTPTTCTVGSFFYDSDATAGSNLYACTSTNVWTLQSGGGGGGGGGGSLCTPQTGSGSITPALASCSNLTFTLTGNATAVAIPTGINSSNSKGQITFVLSGGAYTLAGLNAALLNWCNGTGLVDGQYWTQFFHYDGTSYIGDGCVDNTGNLTLPGSTSGALLLKAAAIAGGTQTFPNATGAVGIMTGSFTDGHCPQISVSGVTTTLVDSGGTCGGGGGGGTGTIDLSIGGYNGGGTGLYPAWMLQVNSTGLDSNGLTSAGYTLRFADSGTPTISRSIWLPADFSSALTITLEVDDGAGAGGNTRWIYGTVCWADGTAPTATMANTATSATKAFSGFGNVAVVGPTSIATSGCSAGSQMIVQIQRDNTVGSNSAALVGLVGVKLNYTK